MIKGRLEVKLPTILANGKHSQEKLRREKIRHGEDKTWSKSNLRRCKYYY